MTDVWDSEEISGCEPMKSDFMKTIDCDTIDYHV